MASLPVLALARLTGLALSLTAVPLLAQEQFVWPPVPPADLTLRDNPAQPGARAMILLKKETRDDEKGVWDTYYRIKIFTEKGREHANIEIPYISKVVEAGQIAARVIQPDGAISPFSGPIFEKTIARSRRGWRRMAKTFSLPGVRPGAIIEYRVRWKKKSSLEMSGPWVIQENLFVREAQLEFRAAKSSLGSRLLPRQLPGDKPFQLGNDGMFTIVLRDLPAFEEEPFMPPANSLKARYHVLYSRNYFGFIPEEYLREYVNKFIGKPKALAGAVQQIVAPQDPPDTKLRKLYLAVQERIRNLSYEEGYTRKELKREGMKERKSAEDVWKLGYGTSDEINQLFVGLCRAAGFTADVVWVAGRDDKLFDSAIPLYDQLNDVVAVVNRGETLQYFDPGTRFAPVGWVAWEKQGVSALRLGEKLYQEITTALLEPGQNRRHRQIELQLTPEGAARVLWVTTYSGQEALERRNEFFETSAEERQRKLREEIQESFLAAVVQEVSWEGLDDSSDSARITFRLELPGFAQVLGSRLMVRSHVVETRSSFTAWKRKHPVYLRVPVSFTRETRVLPPAGYQLEHLPPPQNRQITISEYEASATQEGNNVLCVSRINTHAGMLQQADHYLLLKSLYDFAAANDQAALVFRKP